MKRTASAVWQGTIREGSDTVSTQSRVLDQTPYSFRSRFADGTETNPEELIGAAHAACFAMALSGDLGKAGLTAENIDARSTVTLETGASGANITRVHVDVSAKVPGASVIASEISATWAWSDTKKRSTPASTSDRARSASTRRTAMVCTSTSTAPRPGSPASDWRPTASSSTIPTSTPPP